MLESAYINSRPFRVNAGAVSTYAVAPSGKTAYLTELKSGAEVGTWEECLRLEDAWPL